MRPAYRWPERSWSCAHTAFSYEPGEDRNRWRLHPPGVRRADLYGGRVRVHVPGISSGRPRPARSYASPEIRSRSDSSWWYARADESPVGGTLSCAVSRASPSIGSDPSIGFEAHDTRRAFFQWSLEIDAGFVGQVHCRPWRNLRRLSGAPGGTGCTGIVVTRQSAMAGMTSSGCCADRRCRKFLQVAARAYHWIEQELLRLFHPQTFVLAGPATRHQGIHLNAHDVGGPAGPPLVRATHDVRPISGPVRKPVIVEHVPVLPDGDNVIASVAGRWPNPFGLETAAGILFEKHVRQDVTRAGGEEHAVRERPLFCGIAFRAGRASLVHGGSIHPGTADHAPPLRYRPTDAHRRSARTIPTAARA